MEKRDCFTSSIWFEKAEADDPFTAETCYCAGFDVFGDLLGKIQWIDYLFLLIKNNPPNVMQSACLNDLAVVIAAQGPRDLATQAATSAAAGGSTLASCLGSALAVGAGQYGGAREVFLATGMWEKFACDPLKWQQFLTAPWPQASGTAWPDYEHPFGFDPNASGCPKPVRQILHQLSAYESTPHLKWLKAQQQALEEQAGMPLALTGVVACALYDLGFDAQQAEMLFLLLRLPGAAAFALEQHRLGWKNYPFYSDGLKLMNDPLLAEEKQA